MAGSKRDVVLLNSDTEVSAGWLDKLQAAAYSAPKIATVTPLSNSATICSLPEFLEDNLVPEGVSTEMMGEIVERVSNANIRVCRPASACACTSSGRPSTRWGFSMSQVSVSDTARRMSSAFAPPRRGWCISRTMRPSSFMPARGASALEGKTDEKSDAGLRKIDRTYVPRVATFMRSDPLVPNPGKSGSKGSANPGNTDSRRKESPYRSSTSFTVGRLLTSAEPNSTLADSHWAGPSVTGCRLSSASPTKSKHRAAVGLFG